MPLTLVLGAANSAKAGEVFGAYAGAVARARSGPGPLLVVPTGADARHYGRELAERGLVSGARVTTFAGLAREVARAASFAARVLSPLQREAIVVRAVRSVPRFAQAGPGLRGAASELLAELTRTLVTPQRFAQALRTWAAGEPDRLRHAEALGALAIAYGAELSRLGALDADLFAWRALDALRAVPGRWGARSVFVYGFDDMTVLERDAIETLVRVEGADVTVSLTYEAGHPALAARAETVQELLPLADRVIELPAAGEHYAEAAREPLHGLERRLFSDAGEGESRIAAGNAITLLEAGGERAEAELVAAQVLGLIREGFAPSEIAIVLRSPAATATLWQRVLAGCGVELAFTRRIPFAHTALGRGLLALARCALADGGVEELIAYLRTPGALRAGELADRLELAALRGELESVEQARERLGFRLAELDALRDAADALGELVRRGRRLLAAAGEGRAGRLEAGAELDARALQALAVAATELAAVGERPAGGQVIETLEQLQVQTGAREHPGAVLLADPLAIRARRFRAVFACGLQQDEFPAPAPVDPLLADELRAELARASGLRLRLAGDGLDRERHLFYTCVARPTERLYLSYRSSDEDGNVAMRSPFISDVETVLADGWAQQRQRRLLADVAWSEDAAPTEREVVRARAAARGRTASLEVQGDRRLGEAALAVARHREVLSPGALESYAECPLKWLVEKELQPAEFGPDPYPLARGSLIHAALEQVLRRLGDAVGESTLAEAERLLAEVLGELEAPPALGRDPGVRAAAMRSIEADLRRYLRGEAAGSRGWRPWAIEQRFGFEEEDSLPPLELGAGEASVRLRGVIDRVDVDDRGRALVRDYKSGSFNPSFAAARWPEDHRLQVALYMLVVRELIGREPAGGVYQPLAGRDVRPRGVLARDAAPPGAVLDNDRRDPEELAALLDEITAQAVAIAGELQAGRLASSPASCSRFGCAHPGICRAV